MYSFALYCFCEICKRLRRLVEKRIFREMVTENKAESDALGAGNVVLQSTNIGLGEEWKKSGKHFGLLERGKRNYNKEQKTRGSDLCREKIMANTFWFWIVKTFLRAREKASVPCT